MYIEYIEDHSNQLGYPIPAGKRAHVLNEAGKLLISQGIAKAVEDPENYAPFPLETSDESGVDENESDIISNKPSSKRKKRPRKPTPPRR